MGILFVIGVMVVLLFLHELGHVAAAKLLNLRIKSVGIQMKPVPHPFVAIKWSTDKNKVLIFFFAGMFVTLTLFSIMFSVHFYDLKLLYLAFCVQIILETNPFYSDFTLAARFLDMQSSKTPKEYMFSNIWYLHITLWLFLIIALVSKNYLFGVLFY